jgi:hypothetical protein
VSSTKLLLTAATWKIVSIFHTFNVVVIGFHVWREAESKLVPQQIR